MQTSDGSSLSLSLYSLPIFPYPPPLKCLSVGSHRTICVYQSVTSLHHLTDKFIRQFNQDFLWILVSKTDFIGYCSFQKLQHILFLIVKIKFTVFKNLWSILKDFINILPSCIYPVKSLSEKSLCNKAEKDTDWTIFSFRMNRGKKASYETCKANLLTRVIFLKGRFPCWQGCLGHRPLTIDALLMLNVNSECQLIISRAQHLSWEIWGYGIIGSYRKMGK